MYDTPPASSNDFSASNDITPLPKSSSKLERTSEFTRTNANTPETISRNETDKKVNSVGRFSGISIGSWFRALKTSFLRLFNREITKLEAIQIDEFNKLSSLENMRSGRKSISFEAKGESYQTDSPFRITIPTKYHRLGSSSTFSEDHHVRLLVDPQNKRLFFIDGKGGKPEDYSILGQTSTIQDLIDAKFKKQSLDPTVEGESWDIAHIDTAFQGLMDCVPYAEVAESRIAALLTTGKTSQEIVNQFTSDWRQDRVKNEAEVHALRDEYFAQQPKKAEGQPKKIDEGYDMGDDPDDDISNSSHSDYPLDMYAEGAQLYEQQKEIEAKNRTRLTSTDTVGE